VEAYAAVIGGVRGSFAGLGGPGRGNPYDTELVDIFTPAVITFTDNMTWIEGGRRTNAS
jgi:hypothetical protein